MLERSIDASEIEICLDKGLVRDSPLFDQEHQLWEFFVVYKPPEASAIQVRVAISASPEDELIVLITTFRLE
jgi:hypothetical protein